MNVAIDCDADVFLDASKDIREIVKWCDKQYKKYFKIINQLDGCVLVTTSQNFSEPTWCAFDSIKVEGEVTNLRPVLTDEDVRAQLYGLVRKLKSFECSIHAFDSNPTGLHPYFIFENKRHTIHAVIEKNNFDLHIGKR